MPGINEKTMHQLEIPVVPTPEQLRIIAVIKRATKRLNKTEKHLSRLKTVQYRLREQFVSDAAERGDYV